MKKKSLIVLGVLLLLVACNQKSVEAPKVETPSVEVPSVKSIKTPIPTPSPSAQPIAKKVPIKAPLVEREEVVTQSEEFVPEHIQRSHIEVVKHY